MNVYEVFLKKDGKDEFRHAGSIEAADADLAMVFVRESYLRRAEGDHVWLVDRRHVVASDPGYVDSNADKPHRFNDGSRVAARRKAKRDEAGADR